MKKFLSLVLALVMTMSLVTIGAGATEYKDLKDKSEIQYEEAVAVLNKLGIITGYEDGSFKPTGALTRGAAAKIIVSLMIGADAASSLTVAAAPYKDVPVTNTFAAVISYCKTAGYINGYSDGTFRPTAALTGYAFAKMLLGALGYKGTVEGFSGSGWTMKVASVGNVAGLYNDFKTPFSGNAGITREQACQLALNTLKATKVEYKGNNINVTTGDANVSITDQNHTDVVNNSKTDGNIKNDGKMQFAEEHFTDLKQLSDTTTTFGRPATRWAYKNVTIDKFAKAADFSFTAAPSGDTAKDKVKDLGLDGYKVYGGTNVTVNDKSLGANYFNNKTMADAVKANDSSVAKKLVDLTGNGVVVEVYVDENNADIISDIVVIRTQLMEVNTVSSKTITLKQLDEVGNNTDSVLSGKYFKAVSSVKDDDDAFADLKSAKSGDYMLATYTADGSSWSVDSTKAPTVVTGALTAITRNNSNEVNGITVGGTAYKLAAIRDDDFDSLNAANISATKKDVTLYLDAYGYATYIKDAGTSTNFMVLGDTYSSLVNGKLVTTLTGWDMKGAEISINIGTVSGPVAQYGDIIKYVSTSNNNADYQVVSGSYTSGNKGYLNVNTGIEIKAGATVVTADGGTKYAVASGVKTIFVDYNDNSTTVKSVYVKNGVANVIPSELAKTGNNNHGSTAAQMYLNKDGAVEAIVVKTTSSDAVSDKVLYIESVKGDSVVDGVRTYTYHVWVNGAEEDYTSTDNLTAGQFATYAQQANGNYKLSAVTKTDSATSAFTLTMTKANIYKENKNLIYQVNGTSGAPYATTAPVLQLKDMAGNVIAVGTGAGQIAAGTVLNTTGAVFADLTDHGFSSMKDIFDSLDMDNINDTVELVIVMNNKPNADNQNMVASVAVLKINNI